MITVNFQSNGLAKQKYFFSESATNQWIREQRHIAGITGFKLIDILNPDVKKRTKVLTKIRNMLS